MKSRVRLNLVYNRSARKQKSRSHSSDPHPPLSFVHLLEKSMNQELFYSNAPPPLGITPLLPEEVRPPVICPSPFPIDRVGFARAPGCVIDTRLHLVREEDFEEIQKRLRKRASQQQLKKNDSQEATDDNSPELSSVSRGEEFNFYDTKHSQLPTRWWGKPVKDAIDIRQVDGKLGRGTVFDLVDARHEATQLWSMIKCYLEQTENSKTLTIKKPLLISSRVLKESRGPLMSTHANNRWRLMSLGKHGLLKGILIHSEAPIKHCIHADTEREHRVEYLVEPIGMIKVPDGNAEAGAVSDDALALEQNMLQKMIKEVIQDKFASTVPLLRLRLHDVLNK